MQHGPGTENAYGGVAQAWSELVPILVMPGGYARRLAWVERNYNSSVQMRGITKSAEPVTSGKELSAIMRRAFTRLRSGRGGPVLVEVPNDVWNEEADPSDYVAVAAAAHRPRSGRDPRSRENAARRQAPGALCGPGRALGGSVGRAEATRRAARHSGHHQPAGQERVSRNASAVARLGRPRDPGAGASFPERVRPDPRHRLLLHADEFRRHRCRPARPSSTRRSTRPT